jgi:hypothetical protein
MKPFSVSILLVALALLIGAPPALAQRTQQPQQQRVYKLNITPMSPPRPAMKYRLLPPAIDQEPGNAAQLYMLAASQANFDEKFNSQLSEWVDMPIDKLPRQEVEVRLKNNYLFRFFDTAARRESCKWETTYKTEGFEALLPHLSPMRNGVRALFVKARLQILDDDYNGAIRTIQTGLAAARHLTSEAPLVQQLVSAGFARLMLDDVTELIGRENAPNLYWALADLPRPFQDLRETLDYERYGLLFSFPQLRDLDKGTISPEQWRLFVKRLPQLLSWDEGKSEIRKAAQLGPAVLMVRLYPQAKKYFLDRGMKLEEVEAMPVQHALARFIVESFQEEVDEVLKWHSLPYWQAREQFRVSEQAIAQARLRGEGGPMSWMVPAIGRARMSLTLTDRQIASLQCVEGIRAYAATHDGKFPDSLADMVDTPAPLDPITGQAFSYEVNGDTAIINCPAPPEGNLAAHGWRYEIRVAK